jgi:hypothetical protein
MIRIFIIMVLSLSYHEDDEINGDKTVGYGALSG